MKQITKRKALTGSVGKWSRRGHTACALQHLATKFETVDKIRNTIQVNSLTQFSCTIRFVSQYFIAWKSQCTWAGTLGHSTSTAMTKMHTLPRLFKWWSKGWLQHVWFPPQFPPWYYSVTSFHLFGLTGRFNINVGALMDNSSKSCVVS